MNKRNKLSSHSRLRHLLPVVALVVVVMGAGIYFAYNGRTNEATNNKDATPTITEALQSIEASPTADPSEATTPVSEKAPVASPEKEPIPVTSYTYKSTYEGLSFKYPADWKLTDLDGDSKDSDGVTLSSPDKGVFVGFGLPVDSSVRAVKCDSTSPTLNIKEVKKINVASSRNQLYIVHYSWGDLKSVALTDWDGTEPTAGSTSRCSFPTVQAKRDNEYMWFQISDTADGYRNLSETEFFNHSYVKTAESILSSVIY